MGHPNQSTEKRQKKRRCARHRINSPLHNTKKHERGQKRLWIYLWGGTKSVAKGGIGAPET